MIIIMNSIPILMAFKNNIEKLIIDQHGISQLTRLLQEIIIQLTHISK
jgi:hypothetical protein